MTAVYHWKRLGDTLPKYERRITICSAADEKIATESLLREANEYPDSDDIVFLGEYIIDELNEPPSEEPIEVASEMTAGVDLLSGADIEPEQFLRDQWGACKIESCEAFGFRHSWHNHDGSSSACYNCEVIKQGRLWEQSNEENEEAEQGGDGDAEEAV